MRALLEAIRFLTLLPIPFGLPKDQSDYERNIAQSMRWFPLVGALIGAAGAVAAWAAGWFWPMPVGAVFAVITMAMLTGGLHLDGLADTFDAVLSWRSRERKLEIMKDSRIGTMGALALIAVLLLKVTLIATLPDARVWFALPLACAIGRWADLYGVFFFPAASEGGLGANYRRHTRPADFLAATVLLLLLCGAASVMHPDGELLLRIALAAFAALVVAHMIFARWTHTLGGLTGDTYGAINEIVEVVVLATMAAQIFAQRL
jgi:adenosylcobinamide-GDP ribazoletransferase